jgi:hypothetical protein
VQSPLGRDLELSKARRRDAVPGPLEAEVPSAAKRGERSARSCQKMLQGGIPEMILPFVLPLVGLPNGGYKPYSIHRMGRPPMP